VAKAAIESGVAKKPITNWSAYEIELNKRLGIDNQLVRALGSKARKDPKRVVFADAENVKVLKAAQIALDEGIAFPILLGNPDVINTLAESNSIVIDGMDIINPKDEVLI
jgi:malate dehydrogenase (oxaloacetate-decarboxylating)(NADP+)